MRLDGFSALRWGAFLIALLVLTGLTAPDHRGVLTADEQSQQQPPRTDFYGDPLPKGAVARLGSIRLRHDLGQVNRVAWSPDGRMLASGGDDGSVRLWDVETGRKTAELALHRGAVVSLDFCPDGRLAAVYHRGPVVIWDPANPANPVIADDGVPRSYDVAFSPDGETVAAAKSNNGLSLYSASTGELIRSVKRREHLPESVTFLADGSRLLTGGLEGTPLVLWNAQNLEQVWSGTHSAQQVLRVSAAPDGNCFVAEGPQSTVEVRGWEQDEPLLAFRGRYAGFISTEPLQVIALDENEGALVVVSPAGRRTIAAAHRLGEFCRGLAVSPDGSAVAIAGASVRIRDPASGRDRLPAADLPPVLTADFSDATATIATGNALWDAGTGELIAESGLSPSEFLLHLPIARARTVFHGPGGKPLVARLEDPDVVLSDPLGGGEPVRLSAEEFPEGRIVGLQTSRDGGILAVCIATRHGRHDLRTCVFDLREARRLCTVRVNGSAIWHEWALSPAGDTLATATWGSRRKTTIEVSDVRTGDLRYEFSWPGKLDNSAVKPVKLDWSEDGRRLAAHRRDRDEVHLWDLPTGRLLGSFRALPGRDPDVSESRVALSATGRFVAVHAFRTTNPREYPPVRIFDVETGTLLFKSSVAGSSPDIRFSGDESLVAVGSKWLDVWDLAKRRLLVERAPIQQPIRNASPLAFSSDGKLLAWGLPGDIVRLWDPVSAVPIRDFDCGPASFHALVFSSDSRRLAACLTNGTALIYEVPSSQ